MSKVLEKATYSVTETAKILGISRGSAFLAAKRGELPTLRFGRRLLVSRHSLEKLLGSADDKGRESDGGSSPSRSAA